MSATVQSRAGALERPWPRRSTSSIGTRAQNAGTWYSQMRRSVPRPCSSTAGGAPECHGSVQSMSS